MTDTVTCGYCGGSGVRQQHGKDVWCAPCNGTGQKAK